MDNNIHSIHAPKPESIVSMDRTSKLISRVDSLKGINTAELFIPDPINIIPAVPNFDLELSEVEILVYLQDKNGTADMMMTKFIVKNLRYFLKGKEQSLVDYIESNSDEFKNPLILKWLKQFGYIEDKLNI